MTLLSLTDLLLNYASQIVTNSDNYVISIYDTNVEDYLI